MSIVETDATVSEDALTERAWTHGVFMWKMMVDEVNLYLNILNPSKVFFSNLTF